MHIFVMRFYAPTANRFLPNSEGQYNMAGYDGESQKSRND